MPGECHDPNGTYDVTFGQNLPTYEDSGNADYLTWDPSTLQIKDSETHERSGDVWNETWTQTWTITPAGDPTP
jgi:hypothetical protein